LAASIFLKAYVFSCKQIRIVSGFELRPNYPLFQHGFEGSFLVRPKSARMS
jgi:hypothetical protein